MLESEIDWLVPTDLNVPPSAKKLESRPNWLSGLERGEGRLPLSSGPRASSPALAGRGAAAGVYHTPEGSPPGGLSGPGAWVLHTSRHAKYNPVDSAGRSSDSQCGGARRQPCGESLTVRRTIPGAGRCSSGRPPLPAVSESRKQASRGYKPSRSAICRRGAGLNKAKSHQ